MKTTTSNKKTSALHFSASTLLGAMLTLIVNPTFAAIPNNSNATNADYDMTPPLTQTTSVKPNVIINYDNSASMLVPAYNDTSFGGWNKGSGTHSDFNSATTYYGYFDSTANYSYDATNGWFYVDGSGTWNGNFMNWLTMRRVDVARKVLIGGKVRRARTAAADTYTSVRTEVTVGSDKYWVLEAEPDQLDNQRDTFKKVLDASVSTANPYTPHLEKSIYWMRDGQIHVDSDVDAAFDDGTFNVHIGLKNAAEPKGLIQNNSSDFRFGLAVFNYNHARDIDGTSSSIYIGNSRLDGSNNLKTGDNLGTNGGTLYPCYPDLANGTPTNYDVCLPTHVKAPTDNLIRTIEEYPQVWGTTPIAETLYEIYGYVAQKDHGINHASGSVQTPAGPHFFPTGQDKITGKPAYEISNDWDPYYYTEFAKKVYCCKTYVINVNDGEPYNDWDNAAADMPSVLVSGALGLDVDGDSDPATGDTGKNGNTEMLDDLALWLRKYDVRTDLPNHQEIINYFVFTALGGASTGELQKMKEAAVNGGFVDFDGDKAPDPAHIADFSTYTSSCTYNEWDRDADCIPDTFFNADTGQELESSLTKALNDIRKEVASGTAASVLANSTDGIGTIYNTLYQPQQQDSDNRVINWGGLLHALYIDQNGFFREDNRTDGTRYTLDSYAEDRIVKIEYDTALQETVVKRYNSVDINGVPIQEGSAQPLSTLQNIWEARDKLAAIANTGTQRNFSTTAAQNGRYIFTGIDNNANGIVEESETLAFHESNFNSSTVTYGSDTVKSMNFLGLIRSYDGDGDIDADDAEEVIEYIRGQEKTGMRNRTIKYDGATARVWRLGDIVQSTPAVVAAPKDGYDTLYNDLTYRTFKDKYANRRQMIYLGANDGMLHAFNGGFWDPVLKKFADTPTGLVDHDLGTEVWAYVPQNLLPHLQWLTDINYAHAYYVDGTPNVFDARIWDTTNADTDTHPKGWGTLLAVNMRLGGAPFQIDLEEDGLGGSNTDSDASDDIVMRSSLMIFDITNPEVAPRLLAEFSHDNLGLTTSQPELVVQYQANATTGSWDTPDVNNWGLAFGSGPDILNTATREDKYPIVPPATDDGNSADNAHLFVLNLSNLDTGMSMSDLYSIDLGETLDAHFVGDVNAVDWINDNYYDALYFGTVGGTELAPTGTLKVMDIGISAGSPSTWSAAGMQNMIDPSTLPNGGQPFPNKPIESFDIEGNSWIYAGTGRLITPTDVSSKLKQSFYGLRASPVSRSSDLQDVTGVRVYKNSGQIYTNGKFPAKYPPGTGADPDLNTFQLMEQYIDNYKKGWYIDFDANGTDPSGRVISRATYYRQLVLFSSFLPGADAVCNPLGDSYLYAVYGRTGTAYPDAGLPNQTCSVCITGNPEETPAYISIGKGQASDTILHRGVAITKLGTGGTNQQAIKGIPEKTGRQSWREIIELPAIAK